MSRSDDGNQRTIVTPTCFLGRKNKTDLHETTVLLFFIFLNMRQDDIE